MSFAKFIIAKWYALIWQSSQLTNFKSAIFGIAKFVLCEKSAVLCSSVSRSSCVDILLFVYDLNKWAA